MTFLYILTSDGKDEYIDMTYLSSSFLRFNHPLSTILVLCDTFSYGPVINSGHPLLELIDNLNYCDTPDGSAGWRNRYMKCRMRELIKGDFLYLDADTIPVKPLDRIFTIRESFAAANNHSTDIRSNFYGYEKDIFDEMKWSYPVKHFVNGGVLFWRDVEEAYNLSRLYISCWTASSSKKGFHFDQPALNAALVQWSGPFHVLDNKFNAQLKGNLVAAIDAYVWHFYSAAPPVYKDYLTAGLLRIRNGKKINRRFIKRVQKARIPFEARSKREEKEFISHIYSEGNNFTFPNPQSRKKTFRDHFSTAIRYILNLIGIIAD